MRTAEPNIIPWTGSIPDELLQMLPDYRNIVNHLMALAIYKKVGLKKHFYPLADSDDSGKQKPIPPYRELRDLAKSWFVEHYGGKYKVHYLDSASSFAMQQIKSWRSNGGVWENRPHLHNLIAVPRNLVI